MYIELAAEKLASFNQEVYEFLNKFNAVQDGCITIPLEDISYHPDIHAEIRENPDFPETYRRIHGLHHEVYSKNEALGLPHFNVDGEVIIKADRMGPLYTATLNLRKIWKPFYFNGEENLDPQSLLPLIISQKGLSPYEHFITQIGNQVYGRSLYTVDAEGSLWSLHLAPEGYNFDEEFKNIRKLSSKH